MRLFQMFALGGAAFYGAFVAVSWEQNRPLKLFFAGGLFACTLAMVVAFLIEESAR